jgi:hypothetical protein
MVGGEKIGSKKERVRRHGGGFFRLGRRFFLLPALIPILFQTRR